MMLMTMLYNFLDTAFNSALGPVDLEDIWKSLRLDAGGYGWHLCGNGADLSGNLYFKQNL